MRVVLLAALCCVALVHGRPGASRGGSGRPRLHSKLPPMMTSQMEDLFDQMQTEKDMNGQINVPQWHDTTQVCVI